MESKPGCPLKPIPPPLIREHHDSQIELSKFGDGSSKLMSSINVVESDSNPILRASPQQSNQASEAKPSALIKNRTPLNCRMKKDKVNAQVCVS
jgi:hypothetical protein